MLTELQAQDMVGKAIRKCFKREDQLLRELDAIMQEKTRLREALESVIVYATPLDISDMCIEEAIAMLVGIIDIAKQALSDKEGQ